MLAPRPMLCCGFALSLSACSFETVGWLADTGLLSASPEAVSLGSLSLDDVIETTVVVTNQSTFDQQLSADLSAAGFTLFGDEWGLEPGATASLQLRFAAAAPGPSEGWLRLLSDGEEALLISLEAVALGDYDQDGHDHPLAGGEDCDDLDPAIGPSATELWYDGIDQDCQEDDDYDADGDGHQAVSYGGPDCDDHDAAVLPGAIEHWYDGIDQDCDGNDADQDGDGHDAIRVGGDDCDDLDPTISPSDPDPHDGQDNDCDGLWDEDELASGVFVLSEYLLDATSSDGSTAYLELWNTDSRTWNLMGWTISSETTSGWIDIATSTEPETAVVLCASLIDSIGCDGTLSPWPDFDATGDTFTLDAAGLVIDQVHWDKLWPSASDTAVQLDPEAHDSKSNDVVDSWCLAEEATAGGLMGSPGSPNHSCAALRSAGD